MSLLILRILQISKHSQKLKLANDFYSYCFTRSLLHVQPLQFFTMSKSILTYFKPVGNRNGEQQVKLPNPTGPLMEELPFQLFQRQTKIS